MTRLLPTRLRALALATCLAGCGSPSATPADGGAGADAGPEELLVPPAPGQGLQFTMKSTLAAGLETERCQFFQMPNAPLNVNTTKVRYRAGSHHVLLYLTPYKTVPTQTLGGKTIDPSGVVECPLGATADFEILDLLAVAQSPDSVPIVDFPPGIAYKVKPGAVLLMNTHYVNASPTAVETEVRINLYSIPDSEVKQEGGVIFFYNPFIRIPASGQSSARMVCPVTQDITVLNLQNHMHRRGSFFEAFLLDNQGAQMEKLYESSLWEGVPVTSWKDGKKLSKGTQLDYRCDYKNPEARTVIQGGKSTDEMCMLIGAYYPRKESFSYCSDESIAGQSSAATWIGSGDKNCGETVMCAQAAKNQETYFGCVVSSCPAVGRQISGMLQCQRRVAGTPGGACYAPCRSGQGCETCVIGQCGTELNACLAAKCT